VNGGAIYGEILGGQVLEITNSTFSSCCATSERSKGGGIYVEVGSGGLFNVSGGKDNDYGSFRSCSAGKINDEGDGDGYGGAIYIVLEDILSNYIFGEKITFTLNKGLAGKNIFMNTKNNLKLLSVVNRDKFNYTIIYDDIDELSGYDEGNEARIIPLKYYLVDLEGEIFTDDDNGADIGILINLFY
jgi:hypothetical protein